MGDPADEDDEEAECKREVVRPERKQTGPQTAFGRLMLQADLEDEQRYRNGIHAVAERLNAAGAFCHRRFCAGNSMPADTGCGAGTGARRC
jgi:hypothetical protein